jgi:L-iditol 2-dehydrogenase
MRDVLTNMQALVSTAPGEYKIEEVPVPIPGPDEILCKIQAVALCGSDPGLLSGSMRHRGWPPSYPFVFGHEWAGEVAETGAEVKDLQAGDRIAGEGHCGCGLCSNCREGKYNLCLSYGKPGSEHRHYGFLHPGAFAQYAVFKRRTLARIPGNVSFDAATLCDSAGVALHGLRAVDIRPPCTAAIFGPGPIGCLALVMACSFGVRTIMSGRGARLQKALELGADEVVDFEKISDPAKRVMELTNSLGADIALECSGTASGLVNAINSAKSDGHIVLLGYYREEEPSLPINMFHIRQLHLHGSRANPNSLESVLEILREGRIPAGKIITHTFPLHKMSEALRVFADRQCGALKVILHPWEE